MNIDDQKLIRDEIEKLSKLIDLEAIAPLLVNKKIFTQTMIDDIMSTEDESNRRKNFLIDLTHRGPHAYDAFVEVLLGTNQLSAARILKPLIFEHNSSPEDVISEIVSNSSPTNSYSRSFGGGGGGDSATAALGHTFADIESSERLLKVAKAKEPMRGDNYYKMSANPRGFCLIINNVKFLHDCYPERRGSEAEAKLLEEVFTELHFKVKIKTNLMQSEIKETLRKYAKKHDLKLHDAFVLIILSHGTKNVVTANDGVHISFEDILEYFTNKNCPNLINKPKLCFFICCRGEKRDEGMKFLGDIDSNAVSDSKKSLDLPESKVASVGDFLICYSTIDGYVSWRNEDSGSWVGTSLARALMKHACDTELHVIMIAVSNMVNNKITECGAKQVMEYTYRGWQKIFYFNPGFTDNS